MFFCTGENANGLLSLHVDNAKRSIEDEAVSSSLRLPMFTPADPLINSGWCGVIIAGGQSAIFYNYIMTEADTSIEDTFENAETTSPSRPKRAACEVCQEQPFKYTCPGCERRTCSLVCSKKHKEESGCNGKRDRLKFVSMQDFDDRVLLSGGYAVPCHAVQCPHPLYTMQSISPSHLALPRPSQITICWRKSSA